MLIEKVRQRTFLYDTRSRDYRDQHMRANAWEGIGKELKIKRKFYVSSHDVRIVCPRLLSLQAWHTFPVVGVWGRASLVFPKTSVRLCFFCANNLGGVLLNTRAVKLLKPWVNEFSFQCIYYLDGSHCLHVGKLYRSRSRHTTHTYKIFRT